MTLQEIRDELERTSWESTDMDGIFAGSSLSGDMHRHHVVQAVAPIPIRT
jgi:hypothetical protein